MGYYLARLFGAAPREWSYSRWLLRIVEAVADEYGVRLRLTPSTYWTNLPEDLRSEIAATLALKRGGAFRPRPLKLTNSAGNPYSAATFDE